MASFIVSLSIASVLTAAFAFRFRNSRRPGVLAAYFLVFLTAETVATRHFLPPGVLGIEVALVCFPLAAVFVGASVLAHRWEAGEDAER